MSKSASLALFLLASLFALTAAAAETNILLIVSDDQGWGDVPWHGSPARIPHLDTLRQSGTELLRFYASPECSPTRAALLTGRSAFQQGIRDQFAPSASGMSLLEHLMPETFRAAGYQTALTGKWHLGETSASSHPNARGFDDFYGFLGPAIDFYSHRFAGGGPNGPVDWQRKGTPLIETGDATDLIAGPALARYGVPGFLTDPEISLYRGNDLIATNDDWGSAANAPQIASSALAVGAFAFASGSSDAALLTTLPAGSLYSVVVRGKADTTGTALVEFYLLK